MNEDKMLALSDELRDLRQQKESLEQSLSEVNSNINSVDFKLCEIMTENKTQNFTRNGMMFCLTTKTRASATADAKDMLYAALKTQGYGDLVSETVNANSLSSFVKEQIEQNDERLPEWLDGLVTVFEKVTVGVRKATKK